MKKIKTRLLGLLTLLFPVVIAACYGPPARDLRGAVESGEAGQVVMSVTKDGSAGPTKIGVNGIKVTCLVDGAEADVATTDQEGFFRASHDPPCQSLVIEDVDGEDNGGSFEKMTVEFQPPVVIELKKKSN